MLIKHLINAPFMAINPIECSLLSRPPTGPFLSPVDPSAGSFSFSRILIPIHISIVVRAAYLKGKKRKN